MIKPRWFLVESSGRGSTSTYVFGTSGHHNERQADGRRFAIRDCGLAPFGITLIVNKPETWEIEYAIPCVSVRAAKNAGRKLFEKLSNTVEAA